jgi:2-oxoglutarate-Fe(II)-dependent oxygenase superfamily protein
MIIQLRHRGLFVDRAALEQLRADFDSHHCVHLKNLLEPSLARTMVAALDRGTFADRTHDGIGTELVAESGLATGVLELLANDPQLFEAVHMLTGCGPIGCFEGRVYRMVPSSGHSDSWHSDRGMDRLIAMSINLSPEKYEGGLLQIREQTAGEVLSEVANVGLGDGIVFRISPLLTHRVTNVEGSHAKTAYAGWFRSRPSFRELLRDRNARARAAHSIQ